MVRVETKKSTENTTLPTVVYAVVQPIYEWHTYCECCGPEKDHVGNHFVSVYRNEEDANAYVEANEHDEWLDVRAVELL